MRIQPYIMLASELEDEIDIISATVPAPDDAKSQEHHDAIRAYWDLISKLQEYGVELSVDRG